MTARDPAATIFPPPPEPASGVQRATIRSQAQLTTVSELALERKCSVWTTRRRLRRLAERDKARLGYAPDWLTTEGNGPNARILVNRELLHAAHPTFSKAAFVTHEEHQALAWEVQTLRKVVFAKIAELRAAVGQARGASGAVRSNS